MPVNMIDGIETTSNILAETQTRYVEPGYILKEAKISPTFAIMQGLPTSEIVTNSKFEWEVDELTPWVDAANTTNNSTLSVAIQNPAYWQIDDYAYNATREEMAGPVTAISVGGGTVTVGERGVGATNPAAWVTGDIIIILRGNVKEAGTAAKAITTKPVMDHNFVESFSHSIQVSRRVENTKLYHGSERMKQREKRWKEHRESIEWMIIIGKRATQSDATFGNRWLSGGFQEKVTTNVKTIDSGGGEKTFNEDQFNDWMRMNYDYGGTEKTVFAGGKWLTKMQSFGLQMLQITPGTKEIGVMIQRYMTQFGPTNFVHHRFFTQKYGLEWNALCTDFTDAQLKYMTRTKLNAAIQNNADKFIWDEIESELGLKIGSELYHGWFEII